MTREEIIKHMKVMANHAAMDDAMLYVMTVKDLEVVKEAAEVLKAQEPRLVTESDFDGADEYGYIPVWTEEKDGGMYWECIPKTAITDPDGIEVLRYWTSRPDQATREATPWED